jgi:hypothetical protein
MILTVIFSQIGILFSSSLALLKGTVAHIASNSCKASHWTAFFNQASSLAVAAASWWQSFDDIYMLANRHQVSAQICSNLFG